MPLNPKVLQYAVSHSLAARKRLALYIYCLAAVSALVFAGLATEHYRLPLGLDLVVEKFDEFLAFVSGQLDYWLPTWGGVLLNVYESWGWPVLGSCVVLSLIALIKDSYFVPQIIEYHQNNPTESRTETLAWLSSRYSAARCLTIVCYVLSLLGAWLDDWPVLFKLVFMSSLIIGWFFLRALVDETYGAVIKDGNER